MKKRLDITVSYKELKDCGYYDSPTKLLENTGFSWDRFVETATDITFIDCRYELNAGFEALHFNYQKDSNNA